MKRRQKGEKRKRHEGITHVSHDEMKLDIKREVQRASKKKR